MTHTIGLVVPDNSNPFFAELARVIEDEGFAAGYSVILCNSDLSELKQATYVDALIAKRVDGLIIVSSGLVPTGGGPDVMRLILHSGVPCVAVDRDLGQMAIDQVLVDNEQGGMLAARYLLELGHRRLAYIGGPSDLTPSAGRIAGFKREVERSGVGNVVSIASNGRHDGGMLAARHILDEQLDVTAWFVFNDLSAIGLIGALHRAGRRVPHDLSVIGFDDIPQAATGIPSLTTIAQPVAEMGRTSVRLLLERIAQRDAPYQRITLPTALIERESCQAVPVLQTIEVPPVSVGPATERGEADVFSAVVATDQ